MSDGDTKVLSLCGVPQGMPMQLVFTTEWASFPGDGECFTLVRVEGHVPGLLPLGKAAQVLLEGILVSSGVDTFVAEGVVSKQSGCGGEIAGEVYCSLPLL